VVDKVEHRQYFRGRPGAGTVDLYHMFDLLAIRPGQTLAVQVTSPSNVRARIAKCVANPVLQVALSAGWRCEVWGTAPGPGGSWMHNRIDMREIAQ